MNGLLVVNKPSGVTSRKVVDCVQSWFPNLKMGHTGTLDPLATGVMVLCLGTATRLVEYVQRMDKTYKADIRLGATSDTDDADGTVQIMAEACVPTEEQVRCELEGFLGEIDQVPPAHSAAHVEGQRAYKLARRGKDVELQPRRVRIHRISIEGYEFPMLTVVIDCGKGTYIRALARDLGRRLGCGALVQSLERTRIGPFRIEDALPLDTAPEQPAKCLLPPRAALAGMPTIRLPTAEARRLCQGQRVSWSSTSKPVEVVVLDEQGEPLAVARWNSSEQVLVPLKVLVQLTSRLLD
jgi:tRNA pseudouridine55 synthase